MGISTVPRIVIIDDDSVSGKVLEKILRKEGFSTFWAQNGVEGRAMVESHQPDLILLDINMPGEDGLVTCTALKSNPATADIPVVFISAIESVEAKVEGFKVGGVDYITKPYHNAEVLARVRLHIRLRQAYQAMIDSYLGQLRSLAQAQQVLLVRPDELPEAHFAVCFTSLEEAGGDFYDVIQAGDNIFDYIVADISGHNLGTALATAALKVLIRQNVAMLYPPLENLNLLNRYIGTVLHEEQYATLVYARVNRVRQRLTLVNAGHPTAILVRAGGQAETFLAHGDVLGLFETISLEAIEMDVSPGDRLFLFSDGVIERGSQEGIGRQAGLEALQDLCLQTQAFSLNKAVYTIAGRLFPDRTHRDDDIVLLATEI